MYFIIIKILLKCCSLNKIHCTINLSLCFHDSQRKKTLPCLAQFKTRSTIKNIDLKSDEFQSSTDLNLPDSTLHIIDMGSSCSTISMSLGEDLIKNSSISYSQKCNNTICIGQIKNIFNFKFLL